MVFSWDEAGGFDLLDPVTRRTIDKVVTERAARLVAEARADTAEARASEYQRARQAAEARAAVEQQTRLATEARERALQDKLERLRRQRAGQ